MSKHVLFDSINLFEKNEWDHFHDCFFHVYKIKKSKEELEKIYLSIPNEMKLDALNWGMNDTVFRENLINYFENTTL